MQIILLLFLLLLIVLFFVFNYNIKEAMTNNKSSARLLDCNTTTCDSCCDVEEIKNDVDCKLRELQNEIKLKSLFYALRRFTYLITYFHFTLTPYSHFNNSIVLS